MAKTYQAADIYRLYYDSASSWGSPTWVQVEAFSDVTVDPARGDIEIPEQNADTGHLQGNGDPVISFTLYEDTGDSSVTAMITNLLAGTITHIAIAAGDITTNGTIYWHMEACLFAPNGLSRGEPSMWEVEAKRHANSDNTLTRATISV